jgi:hypothetical protein
MMRRENHAPHMRAYFRDPDFWVFAVSVALTPLVLFNVF